NDFTLTVRFSTSTTADRALVAASAPGGDAYQLFVDGGQAGFELGGASPRACMAPQQVHEDAWHRAQVACSASGDRCELYVDGVFGCALTPGAAGAPAASTLRVGASARRPAVFPGLVDDVALYASAFGPA